MPVLEKSTTPEGNYRLNAHPPPTSLQKRSAALLWLQLFYFGSTVVLCGGRVTAFCAHIQISVYSVFIGKGFSFPSLPSIDTCASRLRGRGPGVGSVVGGWWLVVGGWALTSSVHPNCPCYHCLRCPNCCSPFRHRVVLLGGRAGGWRAVSRRGGVAGGPGVELPRVQRLPQQKLRQCVCESQPGGSSTVTSANVHQRLGETTKNLQMWSVGVGLGWLRA